MGKYILHIADFLISTHVISGLGICDLSNESKKVRFPKHGEGRSQLESRTRTVMSPNPKQEYQSLLSCGDNHELLPKPYRIGELIL